MDDDFSVYALTDPGAYDDYETMDPSTLSAVGVQDNRSFDWAGLGDFIQQITPTAFGVVSAFTDKPISVSGSTSPGAFSASAGQQPVNALAGLAASPAAQSSLGWSMPTMLLLGGAAVLMVFVVATKK